MIRDARPEDAAAIAAIYNHVVARTTAIWNDAPVDAADRAAWIADRQDRGYLAIVALRQGRIAGYAGFGPFRPQDGFRATVEHSVHVAPEAQRQGIGHALLAATIERARAQGRHVMIGAIDAANDASIALHRDLGFRPVGLLPQVGRKFGRWLDLALWQIDLANGA